MKILFPMYGKLSIYVNLMNYYQDKLFTQSHIYYGKNFMSYIFIILANTLKYSLKTFCTSLCLRDFEVSQLKIYYTEINFYCREY